MSHPVTRCKFVVNKVTHHAYGGVELEACAVYDDGTDPNGPNKAFWEATPSGEFKISVDSKKAGGAIEAFKAGTEFYLDLTPAE